MNNETKILETLGKEAGTLIGTGPGAGRRLAQKEALVSSVAAVTPRRRNRLLLPMSAAAAVLVIVLAAIVTLKLMKETPAEFWIDDTLAVNKTGLWLKARDDHPLQLRFEDGSRLQLEKTSTGQIVDATVKSVEIFLGSGQISASIRKNTGRMWAIDAGPYRVSVTGTEFSVFWSEEQTLFNVAVREGSVLVTGNDLADSGITLAAGDRLHINKKKGIFSLGPIEEETEVASALLPPRQASPGDEEAQEAPSPGGGEAPPPEAGRTGENGKTAPDQKASPPPEWKVLIQEGRYGEAMEAAERAGLDNLLAASSLADLWKLADAARYARDGKKAEKFLMTVRERFGGSKRAKIAAFLLGRVALELNKKPAEGITWLKTYLEEDPGGPLAEEALGRLINAYMKTGRKQQASKTAEIYLQKYENGTFSELAKSVLEQ